MKIERLFRIVNILLTKKVVTAKELASTCDVSMRTIYRDIDTLTLANIPIYTNMGSTGGFSIDESYVLSKSYISMEEQKQLLTAMSSLKNTPVMNDAAFIKLSGLFKGTQKNWIEIDLHAWTGKSLEDSIFPALKDAILHNHVIEIKYRDKSGSFSTRAIEPLKIIFKSADWYLVGHCRLRNQQRIFKILRIGELKVTKEIFREREIINNPIKIQDNSKDINITLKIKKYLLSEVLDLFPQANYIEYDTYCIVKTPFYHFPNLSRQLLSYGHGLLVLEPLALQKEVLKELESLQQEYQQEL